MPFHTPGAVHLGPGSHGHPPHVGPISQSLCPARCCFHSLARHARRIRGAQGSDHGYSHSPVRTTTERQVARALPGRKSSWSRPCPAGCASGSEHRTAACRCSCRDRESASPLFPSPHRWPVGREEIVPQKHGQSKSVRRGRQASAAAPLATRQPVPPRLPSCCTPAPTRARTAGRSMR